MLSDRRGVPRDLSAWRFFVLKVGAVLTVRIFLGTRYAPVGTGDSRRIRGAQFTTNEREFLTRTTYKRIFAVLMTVTAANSGIHGVTHQKL